MSIHNENLHNVSSDTENSSKSEETSNLPDLLAGRVSANAGISEKLPFLFESTGENIKLLMDTYKADKKYDKGEITEEEASEIAEELQKRGEVIGKKAVAMHQGNYEKVNAKLANPSAQARFQTIYEQQLNEKNEIIDSPMDVIHEIANFENTVYDSILNRLLEKHNISSLETLNEEQVQIVRDEVSKEMEQLVHKIGLNYLRGHIPGAVGEFYKNKAEKMTERISS